MELDWITVSAQVVNFLILIWLLKRFLYGPIVDAMDRREQRIAARLDEADVREREAGDEARRYRDARDVLEHEREEILAAARRQADDERKRMLEDARAEVDATRTSWQRQVDDEKHEFLQALRRETAAAVEAIARKALSDLADAELERRVADELVERLGRLDAQARGQLAGASHSVRVASAFELDSAVRGRVTRAVHEHLGDEVTVEYARDPELVCGIELTSGGRRLGFSVADYMDELEARIEAALSPAAVPAEARG